MGQCSTSIKAYDFKKISSEISSIKRRVCYLESNSGGVSSKFGVAGEDDMASENRSFSIDNYILQIKNGEGDSLLYFDDNNNLYFYGIVGAGPVFITGMEVTPVGQLFLYAAQKKAVSAVQGFTDLVVTVGDVDNVGNGTKILIDDDNGDINLGDLSNNLNSIKVKISNQLQNVVIGDAEQNKNGTVLIVDDASQTVEISNVPTGDITNEFLTIESDVIKKIPAPVESGTYTPTILSNSGNVTAIATSGPFQYLRVGNTVTVSGAINITTNANGTVNCAITPPISSDFTDQYTCAGVMGIQGLNYTSAYIWE